MKAREKILLTIAFPAFDFCVVICNKKYNAVYGLVNLLSILITYNPDLECFFCFYLFDYELIM